MSQASSRKVTTTVASRVYVRRQRKLKKPVTKRSIIAATSFLSKKYGLVPCFCDHDSILMTKPSRISTLSKSSNAFWHRKTKPKDKLVNKKQQRNNSTATETQQTSSTRSNNLKTFRNSIVQRFKRDQKRKLPTITARSITHKRTTTNSVITQQNTTDNPSNTIQLSVNQPLSTQYGSQHSSYDSNELVSQDHAFENNEENTLGSTITPFNPEQQNINATNTVSQTIQETSETTINNPVSLTKRKKSSSMTTNKLQMISSQRLLIASRKTKSKRSTVRSSKKQKLNTQQKRSIKRRTTTSKRRNISVSKRKTSKTSSSRTQSKSNAKRTNYRRSPFPNPDMFTSMPKMQNSDEITKDNVHKNHLCCKRITSVKNLSTNDQKKLIEHNFLTLISLLPIYLNSHDNFPDEIREKTNISHDGALELDRLMKEWGSTRLFIGAKSHYKNLIQTR